MKAFEHVGRALILMLLPLHRTQRLARRVCEAVAGSEQPIGQFAADCRLGGVIVCSAHLGMWELVPAVLSPHVPTRARRHGLIVYHPLRDASLDSWLRSRRSAAAGGMSLCAADGSLRLLRRALALGGMVGLVADQRPAPGHAAVPAAFLGHNVGFSPGMEALHRATGAPVWFAAVLVEPSSNGDDNNGMHLRLYLERLAPRTTIAPRTPLATEVTTYAVSTEAHAPLACQTLVQCYADAVSRLVRLAPTQYYWLHRRFDIQS